MEVLTQVLLFNQIERVKRCGCRHPLHGLLARQASELTPPFLRHQRTEEKQVCNHFDTCVCVVHHVSAQAPLCRQE